MIKEGLMWSRRSHTKSRNGCQNCKARRIKCDEQPPQCSNCARRQIECDLRRRSSFTLPSSQRSPAPNPAPSPAAVSPPYPVGSPGGLDIPSLELLHHYTTTTYKTLPSASDSHNLWQTQVIQLGFAHDFLLRGILSVSALHLIHLQPSRTNLSVLASTHQSIALSSFQNALNSVDTSNCVALFAFSCIIVVLAFATPRTTDQLSSHDHNPTQKDILDWFHLIRGCNSVLQAQWPTLSTSFLAPLLKRGMRNETSPSHSIPDNNHITSLLSLCSSPSISRDESSAYALAIHELLNTNTQITLLSSRGQDIIPEIFVWPIAIPDEFLKFLRERRAEALVVFGYYAALLSRVNAEWFMTGWAGFLIREIGGLLEEDKREWEGWLEWPRRCTGLE